MQDYINRHTLNPSVYTPSIVNNSSMLQLYKEYLAREENTIKHRKELVSILTQIEDIIEYSNVLRTIGIPVPTIPTAHPVFTRTILIPPLTQEERLQDWIDYNEVDCKLSFLEGCKNTLTKYKAILYQALKEY